MAMHNRRVWFIKPDQNLTPEDLAKKLTENSWTLCTGFRCGEVYWLNDATSEDGAQEYAIVRVADMVQIESLTASWCDFDEIVAYASKYAGGSAEIVMATMHPYNFSHPSGACRYCA